MGVAVNQHAGAILLQAGQSCFVVNIYPSCLRFFQGFTLRSEFTRDLQPLR